MAAAKTLTLSYPVEHAGAKYEVLAFDRPKAGKIEQIERLLRQDGFSVDDRFAGSLYAISVLANVPLDVVRELDVEDFNEASIAVAAFLQPPSHSGGERGA